jgi:hypothetical protein
LTNSAISSEALLNMTLENVQSAAQTLLPFSTYLETASDGLSHEDSKSAVHVATAALVVVVSGAHVIYDYEQKLEKLEAQLAIAQLENDLLKAASNNSTEK